MGNGITAAAKGKEEKAKKMAEAAKYQAAAKLNRKYVWNDFSIGLEKAKIQILSCEGGVAQNLAETSFDPVCDLSVQINPESFSSEFRISTESLVAGLSTGGDNGVTWNSRSRYSDLDIRLHYDIYDEFMARTGNEAYPSVSGFSLMDEKVTSLPILAHFVEEGGYYARFVWGQVKKFGLLTGLNVDYSAFSRWGEPLKAEAHLHIAEMYVPKGHLTIGGRDADELDSAMRAGKVVGNVGAGIKNIFR